MDDLIKKLESLLNTLTTLNNRFANGVNSLSVNQPHKTISRVPYRKEGSKVKLIVRPQKDSIAHSAQPHWKENGWNRKSNKSSVTYRGYYRTRFESCRGMIITKNSISAFEFYLYSPPHQLKNHPHSPCFFNHRGKGKFLVHFANKPDDIDSGIMEIERTLHESFTLY